MRYYNETYVIYVQIYIYRPLVWTEWMLGHSKTTQYPAAQSADIINTMWSVFWALVITHYSSSLLLNLYLNYFQFVSALVPSQGAVTTSQHSLTGNHLAGVKNSKPLLAATGASLSSINKERQVYAQDFPHTIEDSNDLIKVNLIHIFIILC